MRRTLGIIITTLERIFIAIAVILVIIYWIGQIK